MVRGTCNDKSAECCCILMGTGNGAKTQEVN